MGTCRVLVASLENFTRVETGSNLHCSRQDDLWGLDSYREVVCRGVPAQSSSSFQKHPSTLKGKHVVFPPRQCSCSPLQNLHRVFPTTGLQVLEHPPYSPDLAPCEFALPVREEQARRETVFQSRGLFKGVGWRVCLDPWRNVEELVRRLVSKDAKVYNVW
jgi:hypothetical protein